MSNNKKSLYLVIGIIFAVLFGFTQVANAVRPAPRPPAHRPRPAPPSHRFMDSRYHHNHHYPVRGHFISALPRGHHVVVHHRSRYYFHGGIWYRPSGARFVVVAPPFGLVVPFLPLYYSTIWVAGVPYYYANEVYYTKTPSGYVVVEPPKGDVVEAPTTDRLFIYPRKGQSEKQQADDRYACHLWAVDQTNYDPTQPPGSIPEEQLSQKRDNYQRAIGACLDAKGYTVK